MSTTFPAFRSPSFTCCHIQSTSWRQVGGISNSTLQCKCIFNCEWLDRGTGPEAARLDVRGIKIYVGIKVAVLFTKGLRCMHWHARVGSSVASVLAWTLLMTQTARYACVCCEQRGTFTSAFPSPMIRATFRSEKNYAGDKADQHHGERLLRSRPSARLVAPTDGFDPFL